MESDRILGNVAARRGGRFFMHPNHMGMHMREIAASEQE
jgi:hypothetical protein